MTTTTSSLEDRINEKTIELSDTDMKLNLFGIIKRISDKLKNSDTTDERIVHSSSLSILSMSLSNNISSSDSRRLSNLGLQLSNSYKSSNDENESIIDEYNSNVNEGLKNNIF
jgi:hypothetical protein